MLKANELRIGNWAMGNKPFQVDGNIIFGAWSYEKQFPDKTRYEPIPLTEEWLLKFGFAPMSDGVYKLYDEQVVFYSDKITYFKFSNLVDIEYVHQLQNLYFALTGEELKLKQDAISE